MKTRNKLVDVLLGCSAALLMTSATVSAATVTEMMDFGTQAGDVSSYTEGSYVVDTARIVNGNCDSDELGGSGPSCAALNQNETMTISRIDMGMFDLTGFWFELFGGGSDLDLVVATDVGGSLTFTAASWSDHNGYFHDTSATTGFQGIKSVTFSGTERGNRRIDDLGLEAPSAVPLPAAGWLMVAGLGGLAALRRRKRA